MTLLAVPLLWASTAFADGIEPGLWRVTTRIESGGVIAPQQQSAKCLSPEETRDLVTTFSPVSRMVNSECAPIERNFTGTTLTWKLTCTGQLNMEVTGNFNFRDRHHYVATVHNKATMGGMQPLESLTMIVAERVSDCP